MAELSVALRIQAIVDGLASIGALIDEIKDLGGNSQTAGAQAETLGAELADLGKKQAVIDQFVRLKRELQATSEALDTSRARTGDLAQELKAAENPSKALSREFESSARATRELAEREQEQKLALQQMRVEMAAAGVDSKNLARAQIDVKRAAQEAEQGFTGLKQRLVEVRDQTKTRLANPVEGLQQSAEESAQALNLLDDALKSTSAEVRRVGDGLDGLEALSAEIKQLGGESKTADALIGNLRQELDQLAGKQQLIANFASLKRELEDTSKALEASRARTAALAQQFKAAETPSRTLANEFSRAREQTRLLAEQEERQRLALQQLRGEMSAAGISSSKLALSQSQVRQAVAETEARMTGLRARLTQVRDEAAKKFADPTTEIKRGAAEAEQKVDSVGESFKRAGHKMAAWLAAAVGLRTIRNGIQSILEVGGRFETLETRLTALMGSLESGQAATAWIKDFAKQTPLQVDGVTEAFARLKTFGLDPMDGTLQSLVDQNAKMGGEQERLERIIIAVGQAWAKQKLQGEEIMQLVEAGVPVWELLAKATNKNTMELQALSEKGRLGRQEIKLLIDEIGRSSQGAAAAQMSTWAGLVSNLQDTWTGFLDRIARSGALDVFKRELQGVLDTTEQMARDGRLQQYAKTASDAIVGMGRAIKGAVVTIVELKDVLVLAAQAFAVAKVAQFTGSIVSLALALGNKLNPGLKDTGAAVDATAGKVGLLSRAMGLIPTNLKIAIAFVGFELAAKGAEWLGETLAKFGPAGRAAEESLRGIQEQARRTAEESQSTADAFARYADVKIKSSSEIVRLNDAERASYKEALRGAEQYQVAMLAVLRSQEILGKDTKAAQDAVIKSLQDTRRASAEFEKAIKQSADNTSPAVRQLTEDFNRLAAGGKDAGDALGQILKGLDPGSIESVKGIISTLDELVRSGRVAGDEIESGLRASIDKLSSEDLLKLQTTARAAFGDVGEQSRTAAVVLDETLRAAFEKLGLDADHYLNGVSERAASALTALEVLSSDVRVSADAIASAFDVALEVADTEKAFELLRAKVKELGRQGRLSGAQVDEALRLIDDRAQALASGSLDAVSNAFRDLGITSQKELQRIADRAREAFRTVRDSGEASATKVSEAFVAYAKKAIEANGGVASTTLEVEARFLGLSKELDKLTGKASAINNVSAEVREMGGAANDTAGAVDNLAARLRRAGLIDARQLGVELEIAFSKGLLSAQEFERSMALIQQRITELAQSGGGASAALEKMINAKREELLKKYGQEAVDQFNDIVDRNANGVSSVEQYLKRTARETERLEQALDDRAALAASEEEGRIRTEALRAASGPARATNQSSPAPIATTGEQTRQVADQRELQELRNKYNELLREMNARASQPAAPTRNVVVTLNTPNGRRISGAFSESDADAFLRELEAHSLRA